MTTPPLPPEHADLLLQAHALLSHYRYEDAGRVVQALLELSPANVDALTMKAQLALQQGNLDAAATAIAAAARVAPALAAVQYTRGRVHKARGELPQAIECYRRAVASEPANADILTSLGIALRALGNLEEAVQSYRQALAANPGHLAAQNNLANALAAAGDPDAARRGRAAVAQSVLELQARSRALQGQGQLRSAIDLLQQALAIQPSPQLFVSAANLAMDCGDNALALDFVDRLLEIDPHNHTGLRLGCLVAVSAGLTERLARYAGPLRQVAPHDEMHLVIRLALPAVQDSRESIAASRAAYEAALDELLQGEVRVSDPLVLFGFPAFYLAYHGECDRDLQIKAARFHAQVLPSLAFTAPHCQRPRRAGRIRLGFLSRFFYAHSIGKTSRGLIERTDRERFETYAIRLTPSREDETTELIRRAAEHSIEVSATATGLEAARAQLAALELDVLFYQDIGMDPATYLLSFARLAPVQCVSYGHPNTTGVPSIDYFVSNDLYEGEHSDSHYSERLVRLHDLPTLAYYYRPEMTRAPVRRASLGLPERATLYVCPQTLFKIHPDMDELLHAILRRDAQGRLILIRGHYPEWADKLAGRLRRTMGEVFERVMFVPPLPSGPFMQLLATSDVMLDPLYFNGMNSSLEALATGLPVVTLPTALQRGRHTSAMYRKMGVTECIAASRDDYVNIAVRLGTDTAYRNQVRERILQRNQALYEDARVVREFERFYLSALAESQARAPLPDTARSDGSRQGME
jgi:protein O-GlcNAc transferase